MASQTFFTVGTTAVPVRASGDAPATVVHLGGSTVYYKSSSDVSSSDASLTAASQDETFYTTNWLLSAGSTKVMILNYAANETVGAQPASFRTWQPVAATSGTDKACANGGVFCGSIYVSAPFVATGVGYLIGSVGGTDKVVVSLHNSKGELVANSDTAGVTVGSAANEQKVAFTSPIAIPPDRYFVGCTFNGTTAKLRTIPAHCGGGTLGIKATQTFGTPADITAPTSLTADEAPVAFIY